MKTFNICIDVYGFNLFCVIDCTVDELKDLLNTKKKIYKSLIDDLTDARGYAAKQGKNGLIYVSDSKEVDTIFHEVFHITEMILDHAGCKLGDDSSEAYAYLCGYIGSEFSKNIK